MDVARVVWVLAVIACFLSAASPAGAATTAGAAGDGTLSLTYDAATGLLAIEDQPNGPAFASGLILESAAGNLIAGQLNVPPGCASSESPTQIILSSYSNSFGDGWVLGPVLAASEAEVDLLADLTIRYSRIGVSGMSPGDLIYVPEPASLALLGLGGLWLAIRRRAGG